MKLVNSYYEEGISTCVVEHKKKYYRGISRVHPEDIGGASMLFGGRLAEKRAQIEALKNDLKIERALCDECRNFVKACTGHKNFDKESPTAKAVFRQLNIRIKKVNEIVDQINQIQQSIENEINKREIVVRALSLNKRKNDAELVKND